MITSVQRLQLDRYLINDTAVVSDLDFHSCGVKYKIEYDHDVITSSEADELAESFIHRIKK